jgi:hypothetical protein
MRRRLQRRTNTSQVLVEERLRLEIRGLAIPVLSAISAGSARTPSPISRSASSKTCVVVKIALLFRMYSRTFPYAARSSALRKRPRFEIVAPVIEKSMIWSVGLVEPAASWILTLQSQFPLLENAARFSKTELGAKACRINHSSSLVPSFLTEISYLIGMVYGKLKEIEDTVTSVIHPGQLILILSWKDWIGPWLVTWQYPPLGTSLIVISTLATPVASGLLASKTVTSKQ